MEGGMEIQSKYNSAKEEIVCGIYLFTVLLNS